MLEKKPNIKDRQMHNGAVIADRLRKIASIIETHNMLVPVAPELMIPEENQM